ncbi:MAG: amidase [Gammaproteobacteria bacterium]
MNAAEDSICWIPARALSAGLRARDVGPVEVLDAFLGQIERINPRVNAIVSLDVEGARKRARELEAQASWAEDMPLYGMPIAIKDLTLTKGLRTTMGSPIYRDFVPDVDELFVARLRDAGAVILGKTNVPEFGAGSQTFNPVFGATLNPYDTSKTCGGSSGGAAVALACGMLPLADGSDLGGSLRNPASFCNVVGFRPTPGRVPSWPKQFSSDPLAVHGPMARSVDDVALLLSTMAGPDPRVPISLPHPGSDFRSLEPARHDGARIAFSRDLDLCEVEPDVVSVVEQAVPVFESLGCRVSEAAPDLTDADEIFRTLRAWMFLGRSKADYERHKDQLKDTLIWNIEQGMKLEVQDIVEAESKRSLLLARIAAFFDEYDFLVCPAAQVVPFDVNEPWVKTINDQPMSTYLDWMAICYLITACGVPAISVPAGFTDAGLPVGLQIVGRRGADLELLQLAHAFELATNVGNRRPPMVKERGVEDT